MKILYTICAVAALALVASANMSTNRAVIDRVHKYVYEIFLPDALGHTAKCSATAIGPHALLTASHCEQPTDELAFVAQPPAHIEGLVRDGSDHTIYFVDTTFPSYAAFADSLPELGDDVFIIGNPGIQDDIYRRGYVSGFTHSNTNVRVLTGKPEQTMVYYDLNGFQGDSGSALFNESGDITGVLSVAFVQVADQKGPEYAGWTFKVMGGFVLTFTKKQLELSVAWQPGNAIPAKDFVGGHLD